jgi:DNA polymerase-1
MKVVLIDGYNLMHRSRFGFLQGEYSTVFNFFRSLRSLVEEMGGDKIIIALEGNPRFRHELYPEYKAQRYQNQTPEAKVEMDNFHRQKKIIFSILSKLPVEVVKHPDYEGDDLIGKLVTSVYKDDSCIVITADTDFLQLFDVAPNVKIYNPIQKEWVQRPPYDYATWKALVGDKADNIAGIPRVGAKTAEKLLALSKEEWGTWLSEKKERQEILQRNLKLIKFADVPLEGVVSLTEEPNLEWVKERFNEMGFTSITSDKSWAKFAATFSD